MTIFGEMKKYPVVFIGSGISKRYLKNYPTWNELLEKYWNKITHSKGYYSYLNELKNQYKNDFNNDELTHKINTASAEFIENKFNEMFNKGEIPVPNLTPERTYKENISPFKFSICQEFSKYEIKENIDEEEFVFFKEFLRKAKIIITTNYDSFVENLLKENQTNHKKYIGNKGFFDDTIGYSELYKIHGDISEPKSIVITQEDYKKYDANSILISAKILSNLINTQIIFLGYSLSDRNVQKLLKDFSSQFPEEDSRKSAERIIIVQYDSENPNIESIHSSNFGVQFVEVKTNNFKNIFKQISKINEGLTPSEILRYQDAIRTLIINEGGKGNLNKILLTPSKLEELSEQINQGHNIVVAIGDEQIIYRSITDKDYLDDYFSNNHTIPAKLVMSHICNAPGRLPISKHLKQQYTCNYDLDEQETKKLNRKIETCGNLSKIVESVSLDKTAKTKEFTTIDSIKNHTSKPEAIVRILIKNIRKMDINHVHKYIVNEGLPLMQKQDQNNLKTSLRKLFCAYDLLANGDVEFINKKAKT